MIRQRRTNRKRLEEGFSIIEVMVVTAIIALLVTLLITGVTDVIDRARAAKTFNDMLVVSKTVDAYTLDHGEFPDSDGVGLVADLVPFLVPDYIGHLPTTDGWGNDLYYEKVTVDTKTDNTPNPNNGTNSGHGGPNGTIDTSVDLGTDVSTDNGSGQAKYVVCHNGHTIETAEPSIYYAHLQHGDYAGSCDDLANGGLDPNQVPTYRLFSFGSDGLEDSDFVTGLYFDTTSDIVVENGIFVQWRY